MGRISTVLSSSSGKIAANTIRIIAADMAFGKIHLGNWPHFLFWAGQYAPTGSFGARTGICRVPIFDAALTVLRRADFGHGIRAYD